MLPARLAAASAALLLLSGCAGFQARRLEREAEIGPSAVHVPRVPFERQKPGYCGPAALASLMRYWGRHVTQEEIGRETYIPRLKGTLGFDLWRYARRSGLAALEVKGPDEGFLDRLLEQGAPVIVNLDLGLGPASVQHYVLVVGHDRERRLWQIQDGRRPGRVVKQAWLFRRWERAGGWALAVFPPGRLLKGLGPELHLEAADRVEELGKPEAALHHVKEALRWRADDAGLWLRAGLLEQSLKRPGPAESAYREAMRLAPDSPDAFNNLAVLLLEDSRRLAEAEALARRAVKLCHAEPRGRRRLPYTYDTLGLVLQRRRRGDEARAAFLAALSAVPPDHPVVPEIRSHMGAR